MTAGRAWVAAVLRGEPTLPQLETAEAVAAADRERVAGLVHAALVRRGATTLAAQLSSHLRDDLVLSLSQLAECRDIVAALAAESVPAIVLKGAALSVWLYPEPHLRRRGDVDLWVRSRDDGLRAARVAEHLGYTEGYDQGRSGFELMRRAPPGARRCHEVDLHWRIVNAPALADAIRFDEAWEHTQSLAAIGPSAFGLGLEHALLHAAMNRTINLFAEGVEDLRGLYDVRLLVDRARSEARLVEHASRSGLCGVLASALVASRQIGATPSRALVAELEVRAQHERLDPMRLTDWRYMQRAGLASLPWRDRPRWIAERLVPPVAFMRSRHGTDQSEAGLLRERARALAARLFR